jgi:beta-glucosidase
VNLVRLDSSLGCRFLCPTAPALELPAQAGLRPCLLDGQGPSPWRAEGEGGAAGPLALERLGEGPVLLQLFVRGNPFLGSARGREPWAEVVEQLQAIGRLAGLAVYGSPYLWEELRERLADDVPAAWSPGQMPLAQQQVLAALGLEGHAERQRGFTD